MSLAPWLWLNIPNSLGLLTPRRPEALPGADNLGMVRQEKLSHIEGESPSGLNMHDNTKT
jgi:hypothetical protein